MGGASTNLFYFPTTMAILEDASSSIKRFVKTTHRAPSNLGHASPTTTYLYLNSTFVPCRHTPSTLLLQRFNTRTWCLDFFFIPSSQTRTFFFKHGRNILRAMANFSDMRWSSCSLLLCKDCTSPARWMLCGALAAWGG